MRVLVLLCVAGLIALAGCDNIGRAFDPSVGGGSGGGAGDATNVQAVPAGGDSRDGRPTVRQVFPTGGGWPTTTPIVVVFNESLNSSTVLPSSPQGNDAGVTVQLQGSSQPVPAVYDLLDGNRVLIIRPTALTGGDQGLPFEILVDPEVRDSDGIRYGGSEADVVGEFFADQAETFADGEIVTVLPVDNAQQIDVSADLWVVFNKAPLPASVTGTTVQLRTSAGGAVAGALDFPLSTLGQTDNRVLQFSPTAALAPSTNYEVVFAAGIMFPDDGELDFRGRTPFARFQTLGFEAPTAVRVGNPTTGFDNKINRNNLQSLLIDVDTPASASAGDQILVRLYGLDASTAATGDVNFVQRTAIVPAAGVQTVSVPFAEVTGTLAAPRFGDGAVLMAAQMRQGSRHSVYVQSDAMTDPSQDLAPPTLDVVGPPGIEGSADILTDQETLAFYGTASEEIGAAELTDGTNTANLFAGSSNGRFVMGPLPLGRRSTAANYTINLTDRAGNMSAQAFTGQIHQRGVVTGALAGTVTVEAFDRSTLLAIPGATVVLDPATPTVPATAQQTVATDASGRAVFTAVGGRYTVTVVAAGYDVTTLYNAGSAFVSLPLEPIADATARLSGAVAFTAATGASARIGSNLLVGDSVLDVATTTAEPTVIPSTPILANRPQVVTAFASVFEPDQTPAFSSFGVQMAGVSGVTATAPAAPAAPGQSRPQNLTLVPPVTGTTGDLVTPYNLDLAGGAGFDAANLATDPFARITVGLNGFGGQVLMGIGTTNLAGGTTWTIDGTLAVAPLAVLAPYTPTIWSVTQAVDTPGNVLRHRALVLANRTFLNLAPVPGVPTVVGGGTFTTAPLLTYEDRLSRGALAGGQTMLRFVLTDPNGRRWEVFNEDRDIANGTKTAQLPDLTAAGTPLAAGLWNLRAEAWLYFSTTYSAGEFVLAERLRSEVTYARTADLTITVN